MTGRRILPVVLILFFILFPARGFASALEQPEKTAGQADYPVTLHEKQIFSIKTGRQTFSPGERAASISERIRRLAADHSKKPDAVTVEDSGEYSAIVAGEMFIMGVYDADALAEGKKRKELAETYASQIRGALSSYRSYYSTRGIVISAALAGISILVTVILLWLLARVLLYVRRVIDTRCVGWVRGLRIQSLEIIKPDQVKVLIFGFLKAVRIIVSIIIIFACLHSLFAFFPLTRGFASGLFSYVLIPVKAVGSGIARAIPNLIVLAVIIIISRYILKFLRLLFESVENQSVVLPGFDVEWAPLTFKIVRFLFIIFVAIVAFPYIPGADTPVFKGVSIFIGVLFSLGSQSAISNIIAGVALTYRRAFRVGDRIKVNEVTGDVEEIKLQVTRVRTVKNESVIIPNGVILNSNVVNYTALAQEKGLILHTGVTIGYDTPWRQVHAMLLGAAEKTAGLLKDPPPFVLQRSLDDFFVTYELNAYTDTPEKMLQLYSDIHQNIQDVFNEYGVQIMSPHYIGDRAVPTYVPKEHWFDPPAGKD